MLSHRAASRTIRTARLTLRPPEPADVAVLRADLGHYEVARWLGRVPFPLDSAAARAFVSGGQPGRVFVVEDEAGLAGGLSTEAELSFWIARRAWGRGYATEACDAALDLHFSDRRAGPLSAAHHLDNDRSARVLEKLGFRVAGLESLPAEALRQERPARRMVIGRADWQKRRRFRLTTPRLRLREMRPRDLPVLRRIAAGTALAPPGSGDEVAERWVAAMTYRGRPGFVAVVSTPLGRTVGAISLSEGGIAAPPRITCAFRPDIRERGLETEALSAFLSDVVPRFALTEVLAPAMADPAAARFLTQMGCHQSGVDPATLEPGADVLYRQSTREP